MKRAISVFLLVGLLSITPVLAQDAPAENLTETCVTDFDPDVDYFPEKVEITHAENFSVDYFNNYKVLTVNGSMETFTYVLVQCGTPLPAAATFLEGTQFIEVPAGDIVSLSTTFLPGIVELGLADQVVGLDNLTYTSTPEIIERIEAEEIIAVSPNFELNLELLLDVEPGIVFSDDFDAERLAQMQDAGLFTAIATDYLEANPLGRAEWLKYTALFYNNEASANKIYAHIVTAYEAMRELAADVPDDERPTVLWNTFSGFTDAWSIPGPQTYSAQLTQDAGGRVALADEAPEGSALVSFEVIYDGALDADIWLLNAFDIASFEDLIAQDARYADFAAVENGEVWNNDLDVNPNGGNNFFERGAANPHLVLQDLVAIFHPDLLPDHEFNFFRPLIEE